MTTIGSIPSWMLNQPATIEPYAGDSAYGPTYGAAVAVKCRLEPYKRLVRTRDGREVVPRARMFLAPSVAVGPSDRVVAAGVTYLVIDAGEQPGPDGATHHKEVMLQ